MIRFLLGLLVVHFSLFSIISCSTDQASDSDSDVSAEKGEPVVDAGAEDTGGGKESSGDEDQLEADLDNQDAATEPAAGSEKTAVPNDDNVEQDLSQTELQEEPVAKSSAEPAVPAAPAPAPEPPPALTAPEPLAPPQTTPVATETPEAPEKARIRDIRYLSNANGGTVVIETTKPVVFQSRMNTTTQQFVIEIADVELPPALQRPYILKDFGSRFGSINAYQSDGASTARIVMQMSGATAGEPIVQQEGTSLVVVPPTAPPPVASQPQASPSERSEPIRQMPLSARTLDEFLTGNQQFYGRPISFQAKDADVRDVINFLSEESGANVVMSDDVSGKISIKLRKIPWDQALVMVMRTKDLGYVRQGNVLRISTLKALQGETEITAKLLEAQKAIVPAVVQVIPVSYTDLVDLVKSVKPFLSKEGQVVGDNRSGALIVTDKADVVARIVRLVKTLDTAPTQVSIEGKVVEAQEGFQNFVGVTWNMTGAQTQVSASGGAQGAPIDVQGTLSSGALSSQFTQANPFSAGIQVGVLDFFGNLGATLSLAEIDSLAKIISAPRISAINREKSTIVQQSENIVVTSVAATTLAPITKTITRTPYRLQLDVTPQITSDGSVIMDLEILREFLGAVVDAESGAAPINSRRAKTKVLVRNGQTAVIGGIYTSDQTESTKGVPGLMDIPILGWLFKNRTITRDKNELLIFMTPRIVTGDLGGDEQPRTLEGQSSAPETTVK